MFWVGNGGSLEVLNQLVAFNVAPVSGCEATTDQRLPLGLFHRLFAVINGWMMCSLYSITVAVSFTDISYTR